MVNFEAGKEYYMTSACDHNCVWTYVVVSRTAKTVILKGSDMDAPSRFKVSVWNDVEHVSPLGTFSMSPILGADREIEPEEPEQPKNVINLQAKRQEKQEVQELEKAKNHFLYEILPNVSQESLLKLANSDTKDFKVEFTRLLMEASINQAAKELE
jgi:hypothetical protein